MSSTTHVFLIPGCFGFQAFVGLPYFTGVQKLLRERLGGLGVNAKVHALDTLPTASIENRARHLGQRIAQLVPNDGSAIHLVGHSTGGLDARVLLSPSMLPDLAGLRARVRSLTTLATPHFGTPLAEYFARVEGQKLLRLFGLLGLHGLRLAGRPIATALCLGRLVARIDELITLRASAIERVSALLADPLSRERLRPLEEFCAAVRADQSLIRQLSPEGMAGFAARVHSNPDVRYGSVLTRARPPRLRRTADFGFSPIAQVSHALYQGLYRLSATQDPGTFAVPKDHQRRALLGTYGKVPDAQANDGVVPTRSQIHASVIHMARADHHDVIGYFGDRQLDPRRVDWVATGCGFRRPAFDRLWTDVARFMAN